MNNNQNGYQPYTANVPQQPTLIDGVETEHIKYYLGAKQQYFLPSFLKMRSQNSYKGFNIIVLIITLLFGPIIGSFWFFHKKLYKPALIMLGVGIAATVAGFIFVYSTIDVYIDMINELTFAVENSMEYEPQLTGGLIIAGIILGIVLVAAKVMVAIIFAIKADGIYLKDITKKIKAEQQKPEPLSQQTLIKMGSTSLIWIPILIAYIVAYIGVFILCMVPLVEPMKDLNQAVTEYGYDTQDPNPFQYQ